MAQHSYTVTGMTCGHCVASVTEEVGALDGVTDVVVDLASGRLTLAHPAATDAERAHLATAVAGAVTDAGYEFG